MLQYFDSHVPRDLIGTMIGPMIAVLLGNVEPYADGRGHKPPLASQPMHCDLSLPRIAFVEKVMKSLSAEDLMMGDEDAFAKATSMVLEAYRKAMVLISAGPESVFVEVAYGSADLMLALAKAHIEGQRRELQPSIIDECVTRDWPSQVKSVLVEIVPYDTLALSLLTVHGGYKASRNADNTVKPSVRYHR